MNRCSGRLGCGWVLSAALIALPAAGQTHSPAESFGDRNMPGMSENWLGVARKPPGISRQFTPFNLDKRTKTKVLPPVSG